MYSDKVMPPFHEPAPHGGDREPERCGGGRESRCAGTSCRFQIKVEDGILTDVKFKTFGCGAAIATSSMVTDLAIGKTIEEALKITRSDVAENLEGLPPVKMHCSNLAADALHRSD